MIIAVNKPKGVSSYDVIRKLKKNYPGKKIGHGGTLDPLATGVLVVAIGRQDTKQLSKILKDSRKIYEATIRLGAFSETDDLEGPIQEIDVNKKPSLLQIKNVLQEFTGKIKQFPPKYSAIKINGVPAYKRARRGENFKIKSKDVIVHDIKLLEYNYPFLKIKVETGSGVYIRSLARDIGKKLKTGAYLHELKRVSVGKFKIKEAKNISEF